MGRGALPAGDGSARRGRHAKVPAGKGRAHHRVGPLLHRNKRVVLGVLISVALVVIGISLAGRGTSPDRPCALAYTGKQTSDVCADSRGMVTMNDLTVNATPLAAADSGIGALSLCSSVTLSNGSGDTREYRAADFKIQDPSGESNSPTGGTLPTTGALASGATKTATICDDRAVWSGLYAVIYQPGTSGAQRGIWLTQH